MDKIKFTGRDKVYFLDHYFSNIYMKLDADALLYNRKLPHAGLVGSENEAAIASAPRDFLSVPFGVEVNGLIIDRHGNMSRQCDICKPLVLEQLAGIWKDTVLIFKTSK